MGYTGKERDMYPFSGEKSFLRNCWYVAAFADELDAGPIERVIMDEPVALFRMEDGLPAAMWGICPHRYYPLAQGKVIGHAIQCAYHGFEFDGRTGACSRIPSQGTPPARFRQKTYPLVEHGPWLWIWPGDAQKADPALLPPIEELGVSAPEWRVDHVDLLPTAGRAQLMVENLMDLTHVAFLHGVLIRRHRVSLGAAGGRG
ncbi:phenylpropionate dioxygenase-like ring-hydroxylating dioxygenase large terminal subunit [Sphingobium xenophagum]|uniref:Phenylpropionate dioxygenase-like ring-hydroxylating dioxygenase large terminal subunit n=1 Tax=Sphingobium xenophagum TaxID=121428 RepID=A0ABU1WYF4_SPHXE|nr:Rieske 2Fe-2S domain-containing protein [Sphingobium xenophagum]MDR7154358.1 phenylpropionate dioxygenase-like ring-hydroxylating dioxygenase large terminal subunit [Sphingobium xenophagum]